MTRPLYEHTQPGWMLRALLAGTALLMLVLSVAQPPHPASDRIVLWIVTGVLGLATLALGSLTVRIDSTHLTLRFVFGWPARRVRLADIEGVQTVRAYHLGIGWAPGLWSVAVSGFDAVELQLAGGRRLRIGTDEPRKLKAALERARVAPPAKG